MCFVLLALKVHPRYDLILLANRDEFYQRPTEPMHEWEKPPGLIAGRDLVGGGTWLGVDRSGKLALLTNYREPEATAGDRSRGLLVRDFFDSSGERFQQHLSEQGDSYSGFNLLYESPDELHYYSNRGARPTLLTRGVHGLSNGLLNEPWPKVTRGKRVLEQALEVDDPKLETLFRILEDETPAPEAELPRTGVSLDLERVLSPIFIRAEGYGTRSSTLVLVGYDGCYTVVEKTHDIGIQKEFRFNL